MVEHHVRNVGVESSNLFFSTIHRARRYGWQAIEETRQAALVRKDAPRFFFIVTENVLGMEFMRLEKSPEHRPFVDTVVDWFYRWWGVPGKFKFEQVREFVEHSLNDGTHLPQLFAALEEGSVLGVFDISMSDDLMTRCDVYPWLANVYVAESARGRGIGRFLLSKLDTVMAELKIPELFLYTKHVGLYEKFGFEFVEPVHTYKDDSPVERLYVKRIGGVDSPK